MHTMYQPLVSVFFEHSYFQEKRFTGLQVVIPATTQQALVNHGLLCRRLSNGFTVLFDTQLAGRERTREQVIALGITLFFYLQLNDLHFYNYTQPVVQPITQTVFYFSTAGYPARKENERVYMHEGDFVTALQTKPLAELDPSPFLKPFGLVALTLQPTLATDYAFCFAARTAHWQYILVSDSLQQLEKPAVIEAATKEAFTGPRPVVLPGQRKALAFTSPRPIEMKQDFSRRFQLVEQFEAGNGKYKVVQAALPLADARMVSGGAPAGNTSQQICAEIFLY